MASMDEDRAAVVVAERGGIVPAVPDPRANDFEAFFLREHEALFRALWLVTRNRHEAEEVMQDAFLRLLERWSRVRDVPDPVGYLYRTAMNVYRSRLRRAAVALRKTAGWMPPDDQLELVEARDAVVRVVVHGRHTGVEAAGGPGSADGGASLARPCHREASTPVNLYRKQSLSYREVTFTTEPGGRPTARGACGSRVPITPARWTPVPSTSLCTIRQATTSFEPG
jgi:hypothetical protein